jgi:FlaA1/EpsC-like NDP-sugar epimerase
MKINFIKFLKRLINLNFYLKRLILVFIDVSLIYISIYAAYWLRFEQFIAPTTYIIFIFFITYFISHLFLKTYNFSLRFLEIDEFLKISLKASLFNILILFVISILIYYYNFNTPSPGLPRSLVLIQPSIAFILILFFRVTFNFFYSKLKNKKNIETKIIIYSFEEISKNTIHFLTKEFNFMIEGIIFDNSIDIHHINRIPVIKKKNLENFLKIKKINLTLIFINDLVKINDQTLIKLNSIDSEIKYINSSFPVHKQIENLKSSSITNIITESKKNTSINKKDLFEKFYKKTFLVTGGGGTIGSEICKQLLRYRPKKIIILDNSEYNLFQVFYNLSNNYFFQKKNTEISLKLSDIQNDKAINQIFSENEKINYVFHAAAYKHVNLGEKNKKNFAMNNINGTFVILNNCIKFNVDSFVNISTDKAVKPSTYMGKTKRFNEIMVKSFAKNNNLNLSSVRFGNVLGSSGSVLTIFQNKILQNEPITLYGKDTERFFMLTSEAVELVFGSLNLNLNGNVAVLKIAKPYKIMDIARKVANFYNLEIDPTVNTYKGNKVPVKIIPLKSYEKVSELLFNKKKIILTESDEYIIEEVDRIDTKKIDDVCNQIENNFQENILDNYVS